MSGSSYKVTRAARRRRRVGCTRRGVAWRALSACERVGTHGGRLARMRARGASERRGKMPARGCLPRRRSLNPERPPPRLSVPLVIESMTPAPSKYFLNASFLDSIALGSRRDARVPFELAWPGSSRTPGARLSLLPSDRISVGERGLYLSEIEKATPLGKCSRGISKATKRGSFTRVESSRKVRARVESKRAFGLHDIGAEGGGGRAERRAPFN